ncbi:MAG TPA: class I SAM-dependent methyltransferase [Candidatus Dormibacteraeota bacterium]|nr:class I SAM-dependent methyltransferase [Candidatus Dormibacteraeota bacterium]
MWFWDHYDEAASKLIDFLAGYGVGLAGRDVADIGCGDGIIDLGIVHKAAPARLVGYDVNPTNLDHLRGECRREGISDALPESLEFAVCGETSIPAADSSFDAVVSWSAFEHIAEPTPVLREVRRILRPGGLVFIQVWPFYFSEHGSHLTEWFPEGFAQLVHSRDEVEARVRGGATDPAWAEYMLNAHLNRITVDDLHRHLLTAGLRVAKLHLLSDAVHVPAALAHYPPSWIGVTGVLLLASPL